MHTSPPYTPYTKLRHITSSRIIGTNGLSIEFRELEISVLLKIRMPLICMTVEIIKVGFSLIEGKVAVHFAFFKPSFSTSKFCDMYIRESHSARSLEKWAWGRSAILRVMASICTGVVSSSA